MPKVYFSFQQINEYSTRLEILVEERTESLKTETKLTDQLLHSEFDIIFPTVLD